MKKKKQRTEEHKQKLRLAYFKRKAAEAQGIYLPTKKEEREAQKRAKEPITARSVNALINGVAPKKTEMSANDTSVYTIGAKPPEKIPVKFRNVCQKPFGEN